MKRARVGVAFADPPAGVGPGPRRKAPEDAVASVSVGWRCGEALRVPLDFPHAADRAARDLMYVAASLGFLAASLEGDAGLRRRLEREWKRLPPDERRGRRR